MFHISEKGLVDENGRLIKWKFEDKQKPKKSSFKKWIWRIARFVVWFWFFFCMLVIILI